MRARTLVLLLLVGWAGLGSVSTPPPPGVVTFVDGSVEVRSPRGWVPLKEGSGVVEGTQLRTGKDGLCDVQFGTFGVLHLSSNTVLQVQTARLASAQRAVQVALTAGAVSATVDKLAGDDRFNIGTPKANCGVRGTQFAVSVEAEATQVGVSAGKVSVMPAGFAPDRWDLAGLDPATHQGLQLALNDLYENSVGVEPGDEVEVDQDTYLDQAKALDDLQSLLPPPGKDRAQVLKARWSQVRGAVDHYLKVKVVKTKYRHRKLTPHLEKLFHEGRGLPEHGRPLKEVKAEAIRPEKH